MIARFFLSVCIVIAGATVWSGNIHAQSFEAVETLSALNRIPPLQHPGFEKSEKILKRRILDRTNKTVGEVHDVIMNENGSIHSLVVEFDRLQMLSEVYLDFQQMIDRPTSGGYVLRVDDHRLEEQYPEFVASIETAAGGEDSFSVKKLIGASVEAEDGRRLGKIADILFDDNGKSIGAFYIEMKLGLLRGEHVAIPVNMASIRDKKNSFKKVAVLGNEEADALIQIAKEQ